MALSPGDAVVLAFLPLVPAKRASKLDMYFKASCGLPKAIALDTLRVTPVIYLSKAPASAPSTFEAAASKRVRRTSTEKSSGVANARYPDSGTMRESISSRLILPRRPSARRYETISPSIFKTSTCSIICRDGSFRSRTLRLKVTGASDSSRAASSSSSTAVLMLFSFRVAAPKASAPPLTVLPTRPPSKALSPTPSKNCWRSSYAPRCKLFCSS